MMGQRPINFKSYGDLFKGEWKFWVVSKIHFILAGLASNSCNAAFGPSSIKIMGH
jgi:hypothetical protein